jgi:hypothetical protein
MSKLTAAVNENRPDGPRDFSLLIRKRTSPVVTFESITTLARDRNAVKCIPPALETLVCEGAVGAFVTVSA